MRRVSEVGISIGLDESFEDFSVRMNQGKLTQVIDNLVLNSVYWLREGIRRADIENPTITFGSSRPFVTVADNGLGVDPAVEPLLFQPFVTTKPRGEGRGLGLFITQQLLDSVGCEISLDPERNSHGRKYIFQIDLTGVIDGK
jgi:C4-dicarboxylate-specific signal transduction histidine kinase